jgi:hypothetical protein
MMAKITLLEGRNIIMQVEEKLGYYRSLLQILSGPQIKEIKSVETPTEGGVKETEFEPAGADSANNVQSVMDKMDELYLERNKIEVAMRRFESTEQFTY